VTGSTDVYYRYVDKYYAPPLDEYDCPTGSSRMEIVLEVYSVIKRTPKGVRIARQCMLGYVDTTTRMVLDSSKKKFACPTLALAKESFIARKTRQASIYKAKYEDALKAIRLIEGKEL